MKRKSELVSYVYNTCLRVHTVSGIGLPVDRWNSRHVFIYI